MSIHIFSLKGPKLHALFWDDRFWTYCFFSWYFQSVYCFQRMSLITNELCLLAQLKSIYSPSILSYKNTKRTLFLESHTPWSCEIFIHFKYSLFFRFTAAKCTQASPITTVFPIWDLAVINPGKDIQETFPLRLEVLWNLEHIPETPLCFLNRRVQWRFPLFTTSPEWWQPSGGVGRKRGRGREREDVQKRDRHSETEYWCFGLCLPTPARGRFRVEITVF